MKEVREGIEEWIWHESHHWEWMCRMQNAPEQQIAKSQSEIFGEGTDEEER
jgi:hypothetical protein